MVLHLKVWESKSLPGLPSFPAELSEYSADIFWTTDQTSLRMAARHSRRAAALLIAAFDRIGAGWSSPVARQAHNLKVVGSNPTPATN